MASRKDKPIIEVKHLSKEYQIGIDRTYKTLSESLTTGIRHPVQALRNIGTMGPKESFWALKDINFEVQPGEVIGIIGRNGAGKSTLLKILARITHPTEGEIVMRGRVGSLLEVGTGFHPELTGRENIYFNGAILGMKKREIDEKFEEIVKFSGVEQFLDTPVKRYSSGMNVRLAFSVAAHLDPEILLVDEVLAVGDAEFQKKCLGKMSEVAEGGRTVLFVSHNMNAVETLCERCITLREGLLIQDSNDVRSTILDYENGPSRQENYLSKWEKPIISKSNKWFDLKQMYIGDSDGHPISSILKNNTDFWIYLHGHVNEVSNSLSIGYALFDKDTNICVYWTLFTDALERDWPKIARGEIILRSKFPKNFVNEGAYRLECIAGLHNQQHIYQSGVNSPSIELVIQGGLSHSPYWMNKRPGIVAPIIKWDRFIES